MPSFKAELAARMEAKREGRAIGPPPVTIVISASPKNAHTDPESGLRFYTWQGRDYPSVTTLRRMAGLPHSLHHWTISQVILRAVAQFDELQAMLTRERRPRERVLEKNRAEEASKWLRAAATEERDASAALGTAVHDAAALGLNLESVPENVRPRLRQFRHWLSVAKPEILGTEFQVFNLSVGYAGTVDLLVRFGDGSIWLLDLKTGNGVYPEHLLQVLFYTLAEFVGQDDVRNEHLTQLLHSVSGAAVLHLADDHWQFIRLNADAEAWKAARGLLAFASWMHQHPSIADVTVGTRKGSAGTDDV